MAKIPSPCIGVCKYKREGHCIGCSMTEDQKKQQKLMKIMMLVMFPIMLYGAPSGLTLYILTSSIIGTTESRFIRKHINRMEELAESGVVDEKAQAKAERKKKRQDRAGKMYEKMLENAQAKRNKKAQKSRSFKSKSDLVKHRTAARTVGGCAVCQKTGSNPKFSNICELTKHRKSHERKKRSNKNENKKPENGEIKETRKSRSKST